MQADRVEQAIDQNLDVLGAFERNRHHLQPSFTLDEDSARTVDQDLVDP